MSRQRLAGNTVPGFSALSRMTLAPRTRERHKVEPLVKTRALAGFAAPGMRRPERFRVSWLAFGDRRPTPASDSDL